MGLTSVGISQCIGVEMPALRIGRRKIASFPPKPGADKWRRPNSRWDKIHQGSNPAPGFEVVSTPCHHHNMNHNMNRDSFHSLFLAQQRHNLVLFHSMAKSIRAERISPTASAPMVLNGMAKRPNIPPITRSNVLASAFGCSIFVSACARFVARGDCWASIGPGMPKKRNARKHAPATTLLFYSCSLRSMYSSQPDARLRRHDGVVVMN